MEAYPEPMMDDRDASELELDRPEDPRHRPLIVATRAGDLAEVQRLSADATQDTLEGALSVAACRGHAALVEFLAPRVTGNQAREEALLDAGECKRLAAMTALLPHVSQVAKGNLLEMLATAGWTAGALAVLKTLDALRVDTATCRAAHTGNAELVQALLDYQNGKALGNAALRCAVSARHEECTRILAPGSDCAEFVESMKRNGSMAGDLDFLLPHLSRDLQDEVLQIPVLAPFPNARTLLHARALDASVESGTGSKLRM